MDVSVFYTDAVVEKMDKSIMEVSVFPSDCPDEQLLWSRYRCGAQPRLPPGSRGRTRQIHQQVKIYERARILWSIVISH